MADRKVGMSLDEAVLLAFQQACKRRRVSVGEEVERLMFIQLEDWDEPTCVQPIVSTSGRTPAQKG